MQTYKQLSIFAFFIVLNTIMSVNQWSALPIGNTFVMWTVNAVIWYFLIKEMWFQRTLILEGKYVICSLFLLWGLIGSIRGIFVAENYWEYKQLVDGTFCLSLPLFVFAFADKEVNLSILKKWNQWIVPLFFIFFIFVIDAESYHFLIWPIFIYGLFFKNLPKPWRLGIFLLFVLMMTVGISSRAQAIKVAATVGMAGLFYFRNYWTERLVTWLHWLFYIGGLALLVLGITGIYNIFEDLENEEGQYTTISVDEEGNKVVEDAAADTRTFIYQEVIMSAVNNDYVWTGRTPARGNDSFMFGKRIAEELKTDKYERHTNEVCHPNVFTWLGLIGMLLYTIIYMQASWLATYRSKSYPVKILGCFVAFHWALGWIEDQNRFDISSIFLWMCIAICLSRQFRDMDDDYFYAWFYCIFHNAEIVSEGDEQEQEIIEE